MLRRATSFRTLFTQSRRCFSQTDYNNTGLKENGVPVYNPTEYEPFKFKHERENLFYGYTMQELYGKRYGMKHSPQIRREIAKDNIMIVISLTLMLSLALTDRTEQNREEDAWQDYFYHDMNYYRDGRGNQDLSNTNKSEN